MYRLRDKVAVITGAGSGVGRACMKLFAAEGATVVGSSRTQSSLDEVLGVVREMGGEGFVLARDVSTDTGAEDVVAAAVARYGRIDILVHSAGVGYSWMDKSPGSMNDVATTEPDKWREIIRINLDGCFLACKAAVTRMKEQGSGSIVNVASISGLQGLGTAHAYCAAKGGMINLTRALCVAYAPYNIRANCIAPGFIDTPMVAPAIGLFDDAAMAERLSPMRRPGTPEEMAYGCLYLASDEASYCNGTVLVIDGGTTARQ